MSAQPQGHSATSSAGVAEIVNHEEKERRRIEDTNTACLTEHKKKKEQYQKEKITVDADERAKAMAELRSFEEIELPKIIDAGEKALTLSVSAIDTTSKQKYPIVLKALIDKVVAGAIAV